MSNVSYGRVAEKIALKYLQNCGYTFVTKNVYTNSGETDLVFKDNDILVFVEVKARSKTIYGTPEYALTKAKISRLIKQAQYFVEINDLKCDFRLDAVCMVLKKAPLKLVSIEHYKNIVE